MQQPADSRDEVTADPPLQPDQEPAGQSPSPATERDHGALWSAAAPPALSLPSGGGAIRAIADLLKDSVRTADTVYRYGGEEFLIVMPETGHEAVQVVAQRICERAEALAIPHPDSSAGDVLTVSIGHTSVTRHNFQEFADANAVVEDADKALYRAKESGRNRVEGPPARP